MEMRLNRIELGAPNSAPTSATGIASEKSMALIIDSNAPGSDPQIQNTPEV
jgi:hypothetical protein